MKKLFFLINILSISGIVYFAVQAYSKVNTQSQSAVQPEIAPAAPAADKQPVERLAPVQYRRIVERNLFGITGSRQPADKKVEVEKLQQTKLSLRLWGTATGDSKMPFAVIEEKSKRQQRLFRSGDVVQDAEIKMILREKVVLNVNGRDEILEMEKMKSTSRPVKTGTQPPAVLPTVRAPAIPRPSGRPGAEQLIAVKRNDLETAFENVDNLVKQVRIRPHFRNGKQDGLSFTGIRPNSIFRKMGLRNGDVVTGVNGDAVRSVPEALRLITAADDIENLQLQVRRRGRERTLKYNVD